MGDIRGFELGLLPCSQVCEAAVLWAERQRPSCLWPLIHWYSSGNLTLNIPTFSWWYRSEDFRGVQHCERKPWTRNTSTLRQCFCVTGAELLLIKALFMCVSLQRMGCQQSTFCWSSARKGHVINYLKRGGGDFKTCNFPSVHACVYVCVCVCVCLYTDGQLHLSTLLTHRLSVTVIYQWLRSESASSSNLSNSSSKTWRKIKGQ